MGTVELIVLIVVVIFIVFVIVKLLKKRPVEKSLSIRKNIKLETPKPYDNDKKIFINYRKEDSSGYSLALYNELTKWYGKNAIFKDFNNIEPGEDFEEARQCIEFM